MTDVKTKQPSGRHLSLIICCSLLVVTLTASVGFADFAVVNYDNGTSVTAKPWLAGVTQNSVYACLDATSAENATVNYGPTTAYGSSATTVSAGSSYDETELYPPDPGETSVTVSWVHNVKLTGLTADTLYHYQVVHGASTSADYTFGTAPAPGTPAHFGFAADSRSGTTTHNTVAGNMALKNPNMMIYGGDLVYGSSYAYWTNEWSGVSNQATLNATSPFVNAPGNHEGWNRKESDGGAPHKNTRAFTESPSGTDGEGGNGYFSYDYGDVHILVLNNEIDYSQGSDQWNFAAADLAASTAKFKIVASHRPGVAYDVDGHGSESGMSTMTTLLFEPYGVDFVLSGHNHYYQHSLKNGIHHMVIGSMGASLKVPETGEFEVYSKKVEAFAIFDTDGGNTLTMRTYEGKDSSPLETMVVVVPGPVNLLDFAMLSSNWQKTGASLSGDFDDNGTVNILDLRALASCWLNACD